MIYLLNTDSVQLTDHPVCGQRCWYLPIHASNSAHNACLGWLRGISILSYCTGSGCGWVWIIRLFWAYWPKNLIKLCVYLLLRHYSLGLFCFSRYPTWATLQWMMWKATWPDMWATSREILMSLLVLIPSIIVGASESCTILTLGLPTNGTGTLHLSPK